MEKARDFQKSFCFIDYTKAFDCVDHNKLWKQTGIFLKRWEYQTTLEPTVRTEHGTTDWFKIVKGVQHGCILSSWLFNLNAEYIMWNSRIDESQGRVKVSGSYINNLRYIVNSLMAESKEELKSLLMEGERGEWKSWLKTQHSKNYNHGIWSHHFMANRRRKNGNSGRFYFLGSKITADGKYSHEIKRCLLLGRKAMTNLDSVLKNRDITLPSKLCIEQSYGFSSSLVQM